MLNNKISEFIQNQVPDHIRDSGSLLLEFLKVYYKYIESRSDTTESALSLIRNKKYNFDLDNTLDKYVDKFYRTYASQLPENIALDKRKFIQLLNEIYDAKGTDKAYKLLFRSLFNENVEFIYPKQSILRASDGKWVQDSFITVETKTIQSIKPITEFDLPLIATLKSNVYEYDINIVRIKDVSTLTNPNTYRFYFKTSTSLNLLNDLNQKLYIYSDGIELYSSDIKKNNTKIDIINGGRDWRIGQVFTISGSVEDTVCRVTKIGALGAITAIEIVDHGHDHNFNQLVTASPYPFAPIGSNYEILVEYFPNSQSNTYTINISDSTISISDLVSGTKPQQFGSIDSYFAENYIEVDYVGSSVISSESVTQTGQIAGPNYGIDIDAWLASKATFRITDEILVKSFGYYSKDDGLLSNQNIRLQDNYYYQLFSYVLDSAVDTKLHDTALDVLHPAGLKRFSNLNKTTEFDVSYDLFRSISVDTLDFLDTVGVSDSFVGIVFNKNTGDYTNSPTDVLSVVLTAGGFIDGTNQPNDQLNFDLNKYLSDIAIASHGSSTISVGPDYFGEDYILNTDQYDSLEHLLTIN